MKIAYIGHSAFRIETGKAVILIDPFITGNPAAKTDVKTASAGDTGLSLDMKLIHDLYKPVIGILPIGDRFTMGADQAAYACKKFFKFKTVIPCHYASFKGYVADDAEAFLEAIGSDAKKVKAIAGGESLNLRGRTP